MTLTWLVWLLLFFSNLTLLGRWHSFNMTIKSDLLWFLKKKKKIGSLILYRNKHWITYNPTVCTRWQSSISLPTTQSSVTVRSQWWFLQYTASSHTIHRSMMTVLHLLNKRWKVWKTTRSASRYCTSTAERFCHQRTDGQKISAFAQSAFSLKLLNSLKTAAVFILFPHDSKKCPYIL